MRYQYYPGCSLEGTALEYHLSTVALMQSLGVELLEIEDWTCCGASAAHAVSRLLALALPARNLAIAEQNQDVTDILVPCSACYLNLRRVEEEIKADYDMLHRLNDVLAGDHLQLAGTKRVRHLLGVLSQDIGPQEILKLRHRDLNGMRIAPYYGCQCLRPYVAFDDPESPRSMTALIEATGATIHRWRMGATCCGASHVTTDREVGLELVAAILEGAAGADAIVTVCPMCQMNLEGFQRKLSRARGKDLRVSVLYLPQLLGLSLGVPPGDLRMDLNLSPMEEFRRGPK